MGSPVNLPLASGVPEARKEVQAMTFISFDPVVLGLVWLGAVAVAGTLAVAGLVAVAALRHSPPRAAVAPLHPRLREAA